MPRETGFIRAILGRDQTHTAEAFVVEIYSPNKQLGERTQRYHLEEVCDNRELVLVSILRDALANGFVVDIGVDNQRRIHNVEVRTRSSYLQADPGQSGTIRGRIDFVTLATFGMKEEAQWQGAIAVVRVRPDPGTFMDLYLDLQSPDRDAKLVQLDMLRHSYQNSSEVNLSYERIGTPEGPRHWIREVTIGAVIDLPPFPFPGGPGRHP